MGRGEKLFSLMGECDEAGYKNAVLSSGFMISFWKARWDSVHGSVGCFTKRAAAILAHSNAFPSPAQQYSESDSPFPNI
jgi:hypothetical protein